jgi:hypothetical protein
MTRKYIWLAVLAGLALLAVIAILPAAADQPPPTTHSDSVVAWVGARPPEGLAPFAPFQGPLARPLVPPWEDRAPLPTTLMDVGAATWNGMTYVVGGYNGSAVVNTLYRYDPTSNTWTTLASLPVGVQAPRVVAYNGMLYVAGGWDAGGTPQARLDIYNIATNTWTTGAPPPSGRSAYGWAVAGNKIVRVGGCTDSACSVGNNTDIYDPATNTWTAGANYPSGIAWHMCGGVGNVVYCTGGYNGSVAVNTTNAYDVTSNTWTARAPITGQGSWWAAGTGVSGTDMYIFGGVLNQFSTVTDMAMKYDTVANTWTQIENMNHARYRLGGASGSLFAIGGSSSGFTPVNFNEYYPLVVGPTPTPSPTVTGTPPTATPSPTPTNTPMGRCETIPPDPFGYQCEDWVPRTWITATQNTGLSGDDQVVPVPIGFTFSFYGQNFTTANVSSNGNLQFTTSSTAFSNVCPLPASALGLAIHLFWDDLYLPAGGAVYYDTVGSAPNRIFVVEFRDVPHIGTSPSGGTFEVQLEESTGDIWLLYQDVDFGSSSWNNGASASVGIQNATGGYALQYSCNEAVLAAGRVVHIFRPSGTATPTPTPTNTPVGPTPTPTCPPAGNFQVLIVHADDPPPTTLQSQLLADPNVTAVDLFDARSSTPTLAQLQGYDIVVVFSNYPFFDPITLGNNLADYQDGGGVVVANFGSFYGAGNYGIQGRWQTGGYSPYNYSTSVLFNAVTLGTYDPTHPLMQGVTTLNAVARIGATVASGGTQVAAYSDNSSAVAFKTTGGRTAVGMPAYIGDGANSGSGDYARVIVNAGLWLLGGVCPTATPTGVPPTATPTNTPPPTATQAGILYDQYNNASTTGASSQNFEPSLDPYDDELADDFVVPGPDLWFISGIDVDGVYFNGPGPADSVNVRFYANSGGNLPGALLAERLNQPYTGTAGDFSITFTQTVTLGPGTYWVSVQANQNFTPNGQWGWIDRTVQSNNPAAWRNPGGGFGICPDWGYRGSVCGIDPANPDQVFRIRGTSGPPTSVGLAEFGGQAAGGSVLMWAIPLAALGLLLSWALLRRRRVGG